MTTVVYSKRNVIAYMYSVYELNYKQECGLLFQVQCLCVGMYMYMYNWTNIAALILVQGESEISARAC